MTHAAATARLVVDVDHGEMTVPQMMRAYFRQNQALREVLMVLAAGPCSETTCEGCRAEWEHAACLAEKALLP